MSVRCNDRVLNAVLDLLQGGEGASTNKFLHDITVSADGNLAYLSNWDAGLVLLDISDLSALSVVSVALDPGGSLDGEINSHAAWPNEDGTIVIEGEEDFSAWEGTVPPTNLSSDGSATPGDPTIPVTAIATEAGDYFEANSGLTGTVHLDTLEVHGGPTFDHVEMSAAPGAPTLSDTGDISGVIVFVGRACGLTTADTVDPAPADDAIAIIRRGACEFDAADQASKSTVTSAVVGRDWQVKT